jgi:hypothetical protein
LVLGGWSKKNLTIFWGKFSPHFFVTAFYIFWTGSRNLSLFNAKSLLGCSKHWTSIPEIWPSETPKNTISQN